VNILFIPGVLAEDWRLSPDIRSFHLDQLPAELPDPEPDLVILSAALADAPRPEGLYPHRIMLDAVDVQPDPAAVRDWLRAGFRNVVLSRDERTLTGDSVGDGLDLVGDHPSMKKVVHQIHQVAPTDVTVLIRGESGTGKELVARAVHRLSRRVNGPFVPVNCAAIPDTLLEDDLFGHVKGAFTDAATDRTGKVAAADGGTLFLDEIGDMPPALQVKLLRMLQEKEIQPLGTNRPRKVDVRVVAATAADLEKKMERGEFRRDLYYRLNVVPIPLPPLRRRTSDIPVLVHHFAQTLARQHGRPVPDITAEAMTALTRYRWPGNVRELKHLLERSLVLAADPTRIRLADLPDEIRGGAAS